MCFVLRMSVSVIVSVVVPAMARQRRKFVVSLPVVVAVVGGPGAQPHQVLEPTVQRYRPNGDSDTVKER